jgi:glycerate dehydrogenase
MKIVILDGESLHAEDIPHNIFEQFGEVTYFSRTPQNLVIERCYDADIVIMNKIPFSATTISQLPNLKLIAIAATGYNIVDIEAAHLYDVTVCNIPSYGTESVAQHTIALILELTNHVGKNAQSVVGGEWFKERKWWYSTAPMMELNRKTLGIVGFGSIGKKTAEIAKAFGMNIIYYSRSPKNCAWATQKSLEEVFAQSDIISIHCPLTNENKELIDERLISKMKPSSFLINTARGQLINEKDLANALNQGRIKGAALDVLSSEPPRPFNPLLSAKNCIITPHNAWVSIETRQRIVRILAENIREFMNGQLVEGCL